MLRKGMTILEALQKWMFEFNALPNSMIETLIRAEPYDWCEVTMPSEGNTVHVTGMPDVDINGTNIDTYERTGVVTKIIPKAPRMYIIELHDGIAIHRHVSVCKQRTKKDWSEEIRYLLTEIYPNHEKIILVMDNLNTHGKASLYQNFPAKEAAALANRLEIHYTSKHGSWLNIAEIE